MNDSSKKTIGELQELKEFILDWKIPFVHLSRNVPYYSPSFTFADRSWHLLISLDVLFNEDLLGINITLVLESSGPPKSLTYSFTMKTAEGIPFSEKVYSHVFEPFNLRKVHTLNRMFDFYRMKTAIPPPDILTIEFRTVLSKSVNDSGSECISEEALAALSRNKILQDLNELFHTQEHYDVTFKVKEQEFHAHKAILCARSSVFASTFRHDMKEKATGIVDIKDCDPDSFRDFLYFLYCGDAQNLSMGNVFSLFIAADKYDVQELRSRCLEFMKNNLSVDTFCDALTLALQHSEKELFDLIVDFFSRNMHEVVVTPKWQSFLLNNTIAGNEILVKAGQKRW